MAILLVLPATAGATVLERLPARTEAQVALALGPRGGVVAWAAGRTVRVRRIDADGRARGATWTLDRGRIEHVGVTAAVDDDGTAYVAWSRLRIDPFLVCCSQVWGARVPAHAPPAAARPLSPGREHYVSSGPLVAIRDGHVVVAWNDEDGLGAREVDGRRRSERIPIARGGTVLDAAIEPNGTAVVTWRDRTVQPQLLRQSTWAPHQPAVTAPAALPLAPASELAMATGPDGTRALAELAPDRALSLHAAPPWPLAWSPPLDEPRPTYGRPLPALAVGAHGETLATVEMSTSWDATTIGLAWGSAAGFSAPRPAFTWPYPAMAVAVAVRGDRGVVVVERPRARRRLLVAFVDRGGARSPSRTFRAAGSSTPALALTERGLVLATRTPRGVELLTVPQG